MNTGNTKEHELKKCEVCYELQKQGKDFVTEAVFNNGCRADILVLDDFKVIEILKSETEEMFWSKTNNYPNGLDIEKVKI